MTGIMSTNLHTIMSQRSAAVRTVSGLNSSMTRIPDLSFAILAGRMESGTCPRQEVFKNTNREFIWALRYALIFYHIFREPLAYPCFRIHLACNEYCSSGKPSESDPMNQETWRLAKMAVRVLDSYYIYVLTPAETEKSQ